MGKKEENYAGNHSIRIQKREANWSSSYARGTHGKLGLGKVVKLGGRPDRTFHKEEKDLKRGRGGGKRGRGVSRNPACKNFWGKGAVRFWNFKRQVLPGGDRVARSGARSGDAALQQVNSSGDRGRPISDI